MYVYKTAGNFAEMMAQYVAPGAARRACAAGRSPNCVVTMFESGYVSPATTAAHFRKLTPLVLLARAQPGGDGGLRADDPGQRGGPAPEAVGSVLAAAAGSAARREHRSLRADLAALEHRCLPAARAQDLQRQLPGLTSGEGAAETSFGGYRPVSGPPPARPRTTADPLNRDEYMLHLAGRAPAAAPGRQNRVVAVDHPFGTLRGR